MPKAELLPGQFPNRAILCHCGTVAAVALVICEAAAKKKAKMKTAADADAPPPQTLPDLFAPNKRRRKAT